MPTMRPTLAELEKFFLDFLAAENAAGRCATRTIHYYRTYLDRFVASAGGDRPADDLRAIDLERFRTGWHSIQTVQRLYNYGVEAELIEASPFRKVKLPPPGMRRRVLRPHELARLLRHSGRALRAVLVGMRLTLGRPGELRAADWPDYRPELGAVLLADFKARRRRKDNAPFRVLMVTARLARLLERLRGRATDAAGPIFVNARGKRWTGSALRLATRRAAARAGLAVEGTENLVPYTIRHSAATEATAAGVRDRVLADLLGHTNPRTTARYQHLDMEHLSEAIDRATRRRRPA